MPTTVDVQRLVDSSKGIIDHFGAILDAPVLDPNERTLLVNLEAALAPFIRKIEDQLGRDCPRLRY